MIAAALVLLLIAGGIVHFTTGRSPLIWAARALLTLEAARLQGWREAQDGTRRWKAAMPAAIAEVHQEARG